jgi:putative Ca2+/H+ antiporter (TMEM165/GDT1 family)
MALWSIFLAVFVAELGDKTQLATLLFAADRQTSSWGVFLAASSALVLSTLIAVLISSQLSAYIPPRLLKTTAGIGFLIIGGWILVDAYAR